MITVLAGGVGAARLLRGIVSVVDQPTVTAIVNTGDDTVLHGLHISPDIDTVTYTLAGLNDEVRGWGLADETWRTMDALDALGGESWFGLGDLDLATHMYRTELLSRGHSLTDVTGRLAAARGLQLHLLPMSDDPVRTKLTLETGDEIDFQDYFVRHRHAVTVKSVRYAGDNRAQPAPGVIEALHSAERIVICPSNPILSIGPILAVPGIGAVLRDRRSDVWAVSPIVGGQAIKGPADRLLVELGMESSAVGVADTLQEFAGNLVIDEVDRSLAPDIESLGISCHVTETVMSDPEITRALSRLLCGLHP